MPGFIKDLILFLPVRIIACKWKEHAFCSEIAYCVRRRSGLKKQRWIFFLVVFDRWDQAG